MHNGPTRYPTVEFVAQPGWQDAPQTMESIPLPPNASLARPHAHLREGALTYLDVANRSFRRDEPASWRALMPYSVAGFLGGWVLIGLIAWWM